MLGESEGKTFYEIIEANQPFGWKTFDMAAIEAFENGLITEETALAYCSKRGIVTRKIDYLKKARGESTTTAAGLKMQATFDTSHSAGPPPIPGKLKLK